MLYNYSQNYNQTNKYDELCEKRNTIRSLLSRITLRIKIKIWKLKDSKSFLDKYRRI